MVLARSADSRHCVGQEKQPRTARSRSLSTTVDRTSRRSGTVHHLRAGLGWTSTNAPVYKGGPRIYCVMAVHIHHAVALSACRCCRLNFQGAPKGRQQKGETGPRTHFFADFCRFSLIFGSLCKSRDLGVADFRRKPQETADFRRKLQKTADFCRNRFLPFAVSLLARS